MPQISPIEELILLSLARKRLYGLEITRCIAECSDNNRELKVGSLYPALRSLEGKGLVDSEWEAQRHYYCLTEAGVKAIEGAIAFRQRLIDWVPDRVN